jgi:hypothetical protein
MILDLIVDLEIDVACLLDCPESVVKADLEFLQIKLARLNREYLLSMQEHARLCGHALRQARKQNDNRDSTATEHCTSCAR